MNWRSVTNQLMKRDCAVPAVDPIKLLVQFFARKSMNRVWPSELHGPFDIDSANRALSLFLLGLIISQFQPVKLDWGVCAVEPIKLAMHFVPFNSLS